MVHKKYTLPNNIISQLVSVSNKKFKFYIQKNIEMCYVLYYYISMVKNRTKK